MSTRARQAEEDPSRLFAEVGRRQVGLFTIQAESN